eukprot:1339799-Amorphochlora_amoeboformis.AAC.1
MRGGGSMSKYRWGMKNIFIGTLEIAGDPRDCWRFQRLLEIPEIGKDSKIPEIAGDSRDCWRFQILLEVAPSVPPCTTR